MAFITVKFYGSLKSFGQTFQLEVKHTAEAIRALISQQPRLRVYLQQGWYKVRIGRAYLLPDALEQGLFYCLKTGMTLHFTPVIAGAKAGFQMIAGVALIGAAFLSAGLSIAAWGVGAQMMGMMGASMLLGGVSQLLTKTPKMNSPSQENNKKQSSAFGQVQNMAAQGRPVPLAYGRILCGSLIISQGIETLDIKEEA